VEISIALQTKVNIASRDRGNQEFAAPDTHPGTLGTGLPFSRYPIPPGR
jgi:hypothetical protein